MSDVGRGPVRLQSYHTCDAGGVTCFIRAALSRLRVCFTPYEPLDAAGPTLSPRANTSTRPGNESAGEGLQLHASIICI